LIELGIIESGKPVGAETASRVAAQPVDAGAFRASFVASAGILPETMPVRMVKPVVVATAKAEPVAVPKASVAEPVVSEQAVTEATSDAVQLVPEKMVPSVVDGPIAAPTVKDVRAEIVPKAVEVAPRAVGVSVGAAVTKKSLVKSSDADSAVDAEVVVPASAAVPIVIAPVPVEAKQNVPTAVVEDVPVETVPVTVNGAKTAVGTVKAVARETKKAVEAKPVVDATDAGPLAVGVAVAVPVVSSVHVSTAAVHGVVPAATAVGGVESKSSETTLTAVKVAEASVPLASTATDLQTLVATPNVLEVGIATGTHGWLRVRAEMGQMGEVTASIGAASVGAAEGLHKELPAISAYLAGERVGVSSLVVNAAEKGSGTQDATARADSGTQAGAQSGTGQRGQGGQSGAPQVGRVSDTDLPELDFGLAGMSMPLAVQSNGSGGWLSVRV